VAEIRSSRWRGLEGVDEVELMVPCELHVILGKLLVSTERTESVPMGLSTRARCQWRTVVRRGGDLTTGTGKNGLGQCAILMSFLERKEWSGDSPEVVNFDWRVAVVLFTTDGEKLKCGQLTAIPVMRLGAGAPGS
jgi:hypothetical protein